MFRRQNYYSFANGCNSCNCSLRKTEIALAYLDQYYEPSMSIQNCFGTYDDKNYTNVFTMEDSMLKWTQEGQDGKVRNDQNLYDVFPIFADYYGRLC